MPEFAIVSNDAVVNVIVAISKESAEEVTGLEVVESFEGKPGVGWSRVNGEWIDPIPTVEPDYSVQVPSVPINQ
jgi:hypothetical protein